VAAAGTFMAAAGISLAATGSRAAAMGLLVSAVGRFGPEAGILRPTIGSRAVAMGLLVPAGGRFADEAGILCAATGARTLSAGLRVATLGTMPCDGGAVPCTPMSEADAGTFTTRTWLEGPNICACISVSCIRAISLPMASRRSPAPRLAVVETANMKAAAPIVRQVDDFHLVLWGMLDLLAVFPPPFAADMDRFATPCPNET
jgi:hypothetical protein